MAMHCLKIHEHIWHAFTWFPIEIRRCVLCGVKDREVSNTNNGYEAPAQPKAVK